MEVLAAYIKEISNLYQEYPELGQTLGTIQKELLTCRDKIVLLKKENESLKETVKCQKLEIKELCDTMAFVKKEPAKQRKHKASNNRNKSKKVKEVLGKVIKMFDDLDESIKNSDKRIQDIEKRFP